MVLEEEWKLNSMDDGVSHIPLIPWVPNRQEMSLLLPRCFPGGFFAIKRKSKGLFEKRHCCGGCSRISKSPPRKLMQCLLLGEIAWTPRPVSLHTFTCRSFCFYRMQNILLITFPDVNTETICPV